MVHLFLVSLLVGIITITLSCRNNNKSEEITYDNDSVTFYPLRDFIQAQINDVSKTPYFIYQLTTRQQKHDSVVITSQQFADMASIFTRYVIDSPSVKKYYKEDAFNDASTNSITISYTTRNKKLPVQQIDILLDPATQKVKRAFLRIVENKGDTTFNYRLGWKTDNSCSIATTIQPSKGNELSSQSTVVWND